MATAANFNLYGRPAYSPGNVLQRIRQAKSLGQEFTPEQITAMTEPALRTAAAKDAFMQQQKDIRDLEKKRIALSERSISSQEDYRAALTEAQDIKNRGAKISGYADVLGSAEDILKIGSDLTTAPTAPGIPAVTPEMALEMQNLSPLNEFGISAFEANAPIPSTVTPGADAFPTFGADAISSMTAPVDASAITLDAATGAVIEPGALTTTPSAVPSTVPAAPSFASTALGVAGAGGLGFGVGSFLDRYVSSPELSAVTGTGAGALTGALYGSFVPGVGTGVGAGVGAVAGFLGSVFDDWF